MENQSTSLESLWDKVRSYLETRFELLKLKAVDKASGLISSAIVMMIVILIFFIFFVLLNIGIALFLGELLGKAYYGFFAVAGFYAITGLLFYSFRDKWIKHPISNSMVKKLLE